MRYQLELYLHQIHISCCDKGPILRIHLFVLSILSVVAVGSARAEGISAASGSGIFAGVAGGAIAIAPLASGGNPAAAPEISGADMGGLVLLAGGIAVLKGRRKQIAQVDLHNS